ncbi:peptidoglycan-binding protein [Streptomyces sp. ALI-76-A]|uniref:peptidoglycan-binding protein n=1 Tax=Streptomyces sp. ALI-76-A TaxID=3025736 RepID=UPI00256ECF62|nr:peptidoglycan-binding protein [Streptomyces sp. ALI-76-A]MDL5201765.1 peptidoglycan-binding protein [Streptomyces sp. ALI-76-A]
MAAPVFEEFDPATDCDCPGCVHWRRVLPHSPGARTGRHPAAHRAVIVAAAASTALVAGHPAPALAGSHAPARPGVPAGDEPDTPQGGKAPLHGPSGASAAPGTARAVSRADIIKRAKVWVAAKVPYSMSAYWSDGYRQDCSGFVSMAWNLPSNEWTGSLGQYGVRITKDDLQPGDILLFHNLSDPQKGSHVVIFGGWTDYTRTYYTAYEQTRPHTRRQATPYAYWSNSDRYLAYRYKGLTGGAAGAQPDSAKPDSAKPGVPAGTPYPGRAHFGPGAKNKYVTQLGRMLVERGAGRHYATGPGPRWTAADRTATRAFQQAQGWRGRAADGLPGPLTWELLVTGRGRDVTTGAVVPPAPASHGVPGYPGRAMFRPGARNAYVTQLGRQLLKKGFGRHYTTGPGPRWGEADRRAVEAFQRAQGWRGGAADGHPGPETWRRLFS